MSSVRAGHPSSQLHSMELKIMQFTARNMDMNRMLARTNSLTSSTPRWPNQNSCSWRFAGRLAHQPGLVASGWSRYRGVFSSPRPRNTSLCTIMLVPFAFS